MRTAGTLLISLALGCGCRGPAGHQDVPRPSQQKPETPPFGSTPDREADAAPHRQDVDPALGPEAPREWSIRYKLPVLVGVADFDTVADASLDSLSFLAVVPTVEFVRPLDREWTLIPFLGLGAGMLFDGDDAIAILTMGLRGEWTRPVGEDSLVRVLPRLRYDANLNRPDGLLGDWGSLDLAVELRRAFGRRGGAARFQPGIYAQSFWFWNDVEFDVPGLTPDAIHGQVEVGLSLGTDQPARVLGFGLPRIFIGVREGDGLQTLNVRFGEL